MRAGVMLEFCKSGGCVGLESLSILTTVVMIGDSDTRPYKS